MKRKKYYGVIAITLSLAMVFQMAIPAAAESVSKGNSITRVAVKKGNCITNDELSPKTGNQSISSLGRKMSAKPIVKQLAATTSAQSKTVSFNGESQNQSQTVTIPDGSTVTGVATDNGKVSYTVSGNQVTLNVSGGNSSQGTKTNSKTVTDTIGPQSTDSFPATKNYNDGTYSGTLNFTQSTSGNATKIATDTIQTSAPLPSSKDTLI